jgi:hypothetical protein
MGYFENLFRELIGRLQDFLHAHASDKHMGLTLDDALNKLVDMVGELELCVVMEGANSKDGEEDKREPLLVKGITLNEG